MIHLAKNIEKDSYFYTEEGVYGMSQGEPVFCSSVAMTSNYHLTEEGGAKSAEKFGVYWTFAIPSEFL